VRVCGERHRGGWGEEESVIEALGFWDPFIWSKHDFSQWIDDRWSKIARLVGLTQLCFEA
jgi:hypothetical protein